MDELDEKELEGAGMRIEGDHVMDDLDEDDDMDPETGLPKKKPIIPEEEEELDGDDVDDSDDDDEELM